MNKSQLHSKPEEGIVMIKDNQAVTTSLKIAELFGKPHKDVLRAIRSLECSADFIERNFSPYHYISKLNDFVERELPMYYITRDGFTFLAMGFTGKVAAKFKEDYINAFNEMERLLHEGDATQAALKIFQSEVRRFNKRIKSEAHSIAEHFGLPSVCYGDIQHGIFLLGDCQFPDEVRNVFNQINSTYLDAYSLVARYRKLQVVHSDMRNFLSIAGGMLAEYYNIYPQNKQ